MGIFSQPWLVFRVDSDLFTRRLSVSHNNNHETPNGQVNFQSISSHTVGSWWSGPALGMFCHEPNTWHQKIGSRFRAETGHRRSRFGVALADLGGVLVGDNTPGDFLAINQSRVTWVPGACSLALSDLRRVGVRCRSPTLRSLSYPVNCGSSRKGVTHQSVLGHISGCRLQNCRITQLLLYWELSRQGWPRPAGYSSFNLFFVYIFLKTIKTFLFTWIQ